MVERDELLDENLEHIGEALKQTPGAYAVRAEAALDGRAQLALVIYVEKSQQRIGQQQAHAYEDALNRHGQPGGHQTGEEGVDGFGDYRQIVHNVWCIIGLLLVCISGPYRARCSPWSRR